MPRPTGRLGVKTIGTNKKNYKERSAMTKHSLSADEPSAATRSRRDGRKQTRPNDTYKASSATTESIAADKHYAFVLIEDVDRLSRRFDFSPDERRSCDLYRRIELGRLLETD